MSSFVHFKFKSQKEPQRVSFDGPYIQVWDLKREIISISKLGDGTDFELKIYNESTNEEYVEDTDLIHKDSMVLARRLPAAIPGKGRAARYVSGKPPVNARAISSTASRQAGKVIDMNSAQTEEERKKAMFSLHNAQWQQKQEEMAHETRVPMSGKPFSKKSNIPEGEPPHGYICYRCGKKGHWIQACPTNDDPNYENKNRIKRTTGIPRSMLKKIDQSEVDNLDDAQRQNLMVNAEGEYVFAQADEKEWKKHLDRVKAAEEAQKNVDNGDKELQERGLECPIDKRMFIDPMKTPCCGKTYCHDCIENALIENDLTCPGCQTQNISLERLESDVEMKMKINEYEAEKKITKSISKSESGSPSPANAEIDQASPPQSPSLSSKSPTLDTTISSKKRAANEVSPEGLKELTAPAMKRQKSGEQKVEEEYTEEMPTMSVTNSEMPMSNNMMPPDMATLMQSMQMPNMNFPFANMPMSMPGIPFMPMGGMMNPMMSNFMPPNFNMMNGMNGTNSTFPIVNGNNFTQANMYQNQNQHPNMQQQSNNNSMKGMQGVPTGPKSMTNKYPPPGPVNHKFSNQQRHTGKEEDQAYMRQPVNPHRHQGRTKRARQADYREL